MEVKTKIHASIGHDRYATRITARGHVFIGDEPDDNGGKDLGPTPTELVLSGLASCTTATLRMYADRKGWNLDGVTLHIGIRIEKHPDGQISRIFSELELEGELEASQKDRLLDIARKCPVHRMLTHPILIETSHIP